MATAAANTYQAPVPIPGQEVTFYPDGLKGSRSMVAHVTRVGHSRRNIDIRVWMNGGYQNKSGVRYVEDPRLKDSHEVRKQGAWDFNQVHVRTEERFDQLEKRINALNERMDKFQGSSINRKQALLDRCKDLGINPGSRPSEETLKKLIAEKERSQPVT